ncbi:MAG: AgmX/PglI C-terminal domain-containing protein [Deltaproteobacteria bacterium]|nr:AgmX/PglI C-terminal domain-containing protein [Deltaproteobacteria bacterium]
MQFGCTFCRTPYRIKDSRVRGRILTLRCVRCKRLFKLSESGSVDLSNESPWKQDQPHEGFDREVDSAIENFSHVEIPIEVAPWNDGPRAAEHDWNVVFLPGVRPPPLPREEPDFAIEIDEDAIEAISISPEADQMAAAEPPGLRAFAILASVAGVVAAASVVAAVSSAPSTGQEWVAQLSAAERLSDPMLAAIPREPLAVIGDREEAAAGLRLEIRDDETILGASPGYRGSLRRSATLPAFTSKPKAANPRVVANPADRVPERELALQPVVVKAGLSGEPSLVAVRAPAAPLIETRRPPESDETTRRVASGQALSIFRSRHLKAVNACYEMARRISPDVSGRVNVTMQIDARGRIQSVELSQHQDSAFAECLTEKAAAWRFPEMPTSTVIEYSLNLVPL